MKRPISEEEQDALEIVETDKLLDFREFEDEEYLDDVTVPLKNGPSEGESEK